MLPLISHVKSLSTLTKALPPWMLLFVGAAVGWVKSFWMTIKSYTIQPIMSRICVNVEIDKDINQQMYFLISYWAESELTRKRVNNFMVQKAANKILSSDEALENFNEDDEDKLNVHLYPAFGSYFLRWNRYFISMYHGLQESKNSEKSYSGQSVKTSSINIKMFGTRSKKKLEEFLEYVYRFYRKDYTYSPRFNTWADEGYGSREWRPHVLHSRSLDTIYLDATIKHDILNDLNQFTSSREIYRNMGILYKRTYLFHGEPGTGKSSLIKALAYHLKYPIYYFNLSGSMGASEFTNALAQTPSKCLIIFEDIDCVKAATSREDKKDDKETSITPPLTTSDLLNSLDGILSLENRIVIMTTNYLNKLDSALIRAGRVDRKFYIGLPSLVELRQFYDEANKYYIIPSFEDVLKLLPEKRTIGDMQAYITGKCDFRPLSVTNEEITPFESK